MTRYLHKPLLLLLLSPSSLPPSLPPPSCTHVQFCEAEVSRTSGVSLMADGRLWRWHLAGRVMVLDTASGLLVASPLDAVFGRVCHRPSLSIGPIHVKATRPANSLPCILPFIRECCLERPEAESFSLNLLCFVVLLQSGLHKCYRLYPYCACVCNYMFSV